MMETKICSRCQGKCELSMFSAAKRYKDKLNPWCRKCVKEYAVEYRVNNNDKVSEYGKNYRANNKEKIKLYSDRRKEERKEYDRIYFLKNKERLTERNKQYREENGDRTREQKKLYRSINKDKLYEHKKVYVSTHKEQVARTSKKFRKNNTEYYRMHCNNRRARKRKLPHTLTVEQWGQVKERFNGKCAYCEKEKDLTQEHFVPIAKGGEYTHNNIIPACQSCNSSKGNRDFFEWYPKFRHYIKKREKFILDYLGYKNKVQQLALM